MVSTNLKSASGMLANKAAKKDLSAQFLLFGSKITAEVNDQLDTSSIQPLN
jgi:hypothetical protein